MLLLRHSFLRTLRRLRGHREAFDGCGVKIFTKIVTFAQSQILSMYPCFIIFDADLQIGNSTLAISEVL